MFAVVLFVDTNDVAVVPVSWIRGRYCHWPNSKVVHKLAKAMQFPKSDWTRHEIVIKSIYETYDDAKRSEKKFEDTSNIETEEEETFRKSKRGQKRKILHNKSSSEEENSASLFSFTFVPLHSTMIKEEDQSVESVSSKYNEASMPKNGREKSLSLEGTSAGTSSDHHSRRHQTDSTLILKEILHLKLAVRENNELLHSVLTSLSKLTEKRENTTIFPSADLPVKLPVQTYEDLILLEEELSNDDVRESLSSLISQAGGINLGNMIRRMLSRLLSNNVAIRFSWLGTKEKEAFCSLKISKLIFSAVRGNDIYKTSTDREIETSIKDWLRHAKARLKYKEQ